MIPVEPSQLYESIKQSDRMVIKEYGRDGEAILFESSDRQDLESFSKSLVLVKPLPGTLFHCMCSGSPVVYFYKGTNETVHVSNHHGKSIRCSLWTSDVNIEDIDKWAQWFDEHGISSIKEAIAESKIRMEEIRKEREAWEKVMPEELLPTWKKYVDYSTGTEKIRPIAKKLKRVIPDQNERILVLLQWFGSGAGPWSGYPSYEGTVETMLLDYSTSEILSAIQSVSLTHAQIEGGARLFGGWDFSKERPDDLNEVPEEMKQMFWNHVKSTEDDDKLSRAKSAFTK
jgi:hypothetical protein